MQAWNYFNHRHRQMLGLSTRSESLEQKSSVRRTVESIKRDENQVDKNED